MACGNYTALEEEETEASPGHISLEISTKNIGSVSGGYALHAAVTRIDLAECRRLISSENINLKNDQGSTPLHILAQKYSKKKQDSSKILDLLLQKGANVNARDKEENTPLHIAAREGHDEFCSRIIAHHEQLNLNALNSKKRMTPLHLAAQQDQSKVIELLLMKGADANIEDCAEYTPLHHAAERGNIKCFELLFDSYPRGTQKKSKPLPPLLLAAKHGHGRCFKNLRLAKEDLDYQDTHGNTALHMASKKGYDRTVSQLLDMGASFDLQNKEGNTPIMETISRYSVSCLSVLKDKGAKLNIVNKQRRGLLHIAAEKKAYECMGLLLKNDEVMTNINEKDNKGETPFIVALRKGCDKCSNLLMEAGAVPTVKCTGKLMPLHYVAQNTTLHLLLPKLLKIRDIDINEKEENSLRTPLHFAAESGSMDACSMLLKRGARVDSTDKHGETPLHVAAYFGHSSVVKLLIKREAKIRVLNDKKDTPLHAAAVSGDLECCEVLVKADHKLALMQDVEKRYPHDVAFKHNKINAFDFLLQELPHSSSKQLPKELIDNLHAEMHEAIKKENRIAVEAIVKSPWYFGFFVNRGIQHESTVSRNFIQIIKQYPDLANIVMDKCITAPCQTHKYGTYNFKLLEDNFCYREDNQRLQTATCKTPHTSDGEEDPGSKNIAEFIQDPLVWKQEHPLNVMAKYNRLKLIEHPLVQKWLHYKWRQYARRIYVSLLFVQIFYVVTLGVCLSNVYNDSQVEREFNVTMEMLCKGNPSTPNVTSATDHVIGAVSSNSIRASFAFLLMSVFLMFIAESNSICKLRLNYFRSMSNDFKILSLMLTFFMMFSNSPCCFWIKSVISWECGIWGFLLSTASLIIYINKHPSCSFFSSFSHSSVKTYLKVAMFAAIIIQTFAFTFYLLLNEDHDAFVNVPQSFVKTVVWMLGDLNYDDGFTKLNLSYPVLVNIFFLLFICTVSGFIISLIKAPTIDSHRLILLKAKSNVDLFLTMDVCFPSLQRKHVVREYTDEKKSQLVSILECMYCSYSKRSFLSNKLYSQINAITLLNVIEHNKPWLIEKVENISKWLAQYADEDDDHPCPDQVQDSLEKQNLKLDQLLALYTQLNHSCQMQSDQITELVHNCKLQNEQIVELKQQLRREAGKNSWGETSIS